MKKLVIAILLTAFTVPSMAGTAERLKIMHISVSTKTSRMIITTNRDINPDCTGNTNQGILDTFNSAYIARIQALLTAALLSGKTVTFEYAGCSENQGALIRRVTLNKH